VLRAVEQGHVDAAAAADHVQVGGDPPIARDHEAGAHAHPATAKASLHPHDGGLAAIDDLPRRQAGPRGRPDRAAAGREQPRQHEPESNRAAHTESVAPGAMTGEPADSG
jgi:hypothetical protein